MTVVRVDAEADFVKAVEEGVAGDSRGDGCRLHVGHESATLFLPSGKELIPSDWIAVGPEEAGTKVWYRYATTFGAGFTAADLVKRVRGVFAAPSE